MKVNEIIKRNRMVKRAIKDLDEEREETLGQLIEPCQWCKTGEEITHRCMQCRSNYYEGYNKKTYPDW